MNNSSEGIAGDLSQLHDIIIPEPISFWPLADGWPVLLLLIISFLSPWLIQYYRTYQANAYRRSALTELEHISQINEPQQRANKLFELLKRTALSVYPREQIASLSGDQWWQFLNNNSGITFSASTQQYCTEVLYNPAFFGKKELNDKAAEKSPCEHFQQEVKAWIKQHKPIDSVTGRENV